MQNSLIAPEYLKPGDSIGLISTARKISESEIQFAVQTIESWGLKVILGPNLFKSENQFSGSDNERAADLQFMISHPEVKAILCSRGGYGTVRILDKVDFKPFLARPKWVAGYSDITALHAKINHELGIQSLHATMPINFQSNTSESIESLRKALFGELKSYDFESGSELKFSAEGILGGGNLSMIYSLSGSEDFWKTEGGLLFLEDLDEYLYHIDRMMMNLKRSGLLSRMKGILLGGMTDMNDNAIPYGKSAIEIIEEHAAEIGVAVITGFPAGHIDDNRTMYFGRWHNLRVDGTQATLQF